MMRILFRTEDLFHVKYEKLLVAGTLWCEALMTDAQIAALKVPFHCI